MDLLKSKETGEGAMRGKSLGLCFAWLMFATAAAISPSMAQNPPAPAAGCQIGPANASTASIVQATGESLQRKRWQPQGGVIQFTVKSFPAIPEKA